MRAVAALDKEVERIKGATSVPITARNRIGYPGAQTLAAIDDDRTIDLVVMGSHGRTGIKRAFLGSVAEKVVRHARCPVLVARKRG
jgi:nucleotide-binding universal stress UspA family protein